MVLLDLALIGQLVHPVCGSTIEKRFLWPKISTFTSKVPIAASIYPTRNLENLDYAQKIKAAGCCKSHCNLGFQEGASSRIQGGGFFGGL
jgi:hypothetical protein